MSVAEANGRAAELPEPALPADAPGHIGRVLEALANCGRGASQNGDPCVWLSRCPLCDGELQVRDVDWGDGTLRARLFCAGRCNERSIQSKLSLRDEELVGTAGVASPSAALPDVRIVTLEEFAAVDEAGAAAILGDPSSILIPEGGDVMLYGNGGAGKTTLSIDLAFHLAAGEAWLQIPVPSPRRVLMIESEGPRPFFRRKLARKLEAWNGRSINGNVSVFEHPWGAFSFAEETWRAVLSQRVAASEIDVLIAGPLVRLGMDSAGTLQEVRAFVELVADVRRQSDRALTVVLVHHENKGGAVSGAWEGAGDTLLHVQAAGNGHTIVFVQKARWDSERHGKTLQLAWTDGEGFRLEGDRDYLAEIEELLADGQWRTSKEIAAPEDEGGIGAGEKTVRAMLNQNPERFESRTGDDARALGRSKSATVWQVSSGSNPPDSPCEFQGGAEEGAALRPSLKGAAPDEHTPADAAEGELRAPAHPAQFDADAELERLAAKGPLDDDGTQGATA